jgi:regulator of protease activity HflC (stomatin/prohibitin superfamily)
MGYQYDIMYISLVIGNKEELMSSEKVAAKFNGWASLFVLIVLSLAIGGGIAGGLSTGIGALAVICCILGAFVGLCYKGLFSVEPNQGVVLLLAGKYKGTTKDAGFWWVNPLYTKKKLSLRSHSVDSEKLKVNDKRGNPIEISAVIVWKIVDTAQAAFDVDNYLTYVMVQAESAVRHLATSYAYDNAEGEEISLRSSIQEVSEALGKEIQERVRAAGVLIEEARINHLAYAPEIASAMLQRQQAEAIIAARQKIVDGAVGMVQMALNRLREDGVLELDEERKATMVSNLMVVLCAEKATQPVINAGSLY